MTLALLAYAAPLLALLCALLARRYPGEQAITWLRARLAPARTRRSAAAMVAGHRRDQPLLPRGGRLVAAAVAARPPPSRMAYRKPSSNSIQGATS